MSSISVKEFSELAYIDQRNVYTYIKRGKIYPDKKKVDGKLINVFDLENELNKAFIKKRKELQLNKRPERTKPAANNTRQRKKDSNQSDEGKDELVLYAKEKQRLELERLKKDIEIKEARIAKDKNEVIELDKTISIVRNYSTTLKKGIAESMQLLIQDICARYKINSGKMGEYKLQVIDLINKNSEKTTSEIFKLMEND